MSFLPLFIALIILMFDAALEMSFIVSMVWFLHHDAGKAFTIDAPNGTFDLHGKPKNLLVNQGHASNGAAGTALILVGFGGLIVLFYERFRARKTGAIKLSGLYTAWAVFTVISSLFTFSVMIAVFVLHNQSSGQTIDLAVAAANPEPAMYPLDQWTPDNWFDAVLKLPLANQSDRNTINNFMPVIRGTAWNLIPLFLLSLPVAGLAVRELFVGRRQQKVMSPPLRETQPFMEQREWP